MKKKQKLRVGVIGGGAVVEKFYLPVLYNNPDVLVECIVDVDEERSKRLSEMYGVPNQSNNHRNVIGKIDAAIVATPHHTHSKISNDFLTNGIPVLVEKPMGISEKECVEMNQLSNARSAVLAVGHIERFYENNLFLKQCIESGIFGRIEKYEYQRGHRFDWDVVSDFQFRREYGGGVLWDIGIHVIDKLGWWFGGFESGDYWDNSTGGAETDCVCEMRHESGVQGRIELSRTRNLRNSVSLFSDRGKVVVESGYNGTIRVFHNDVEESYEVFPSSKYTGQRKMISYFWNLVRDFTDSIESERPPRVSGEEGIRAVRAIEMLQSSRRELRLSWDEMPHEQYEALQ